MASTINVIYTGGTIGMDETEKGLVPSSGIQKKIAEALPEYSHTAEIDLLFTEFDPLVDSSHADLDLAVKITESVLSLLSKGERFLVLMGSDTLAFISAALAYLLRDQQLKLVVCGSMKPLGVADSDATINLSTAISALLSCDGKSASTQNVQVAFGGKLIPASRCSKLFANKPDAMIHTGNSQISYPKKSKVTLPEWGTRGAQSFDIRILRAVPSMPVQAVSALLSGKPDACIIECYGSGTLPNERSPFSSTVKALASKGLPIFVISQCKDVAVDVSTYASSGWLSNADICTCGDMNIEAAYTKLWYLLNLGITGSELKVLMKKNICGEISC